MRFFNSLIIVLVLLLFSSTCIAAQDTQQQIELKNCTKVSLETSMGCIVVALYNDTPIHRDNFIKLVKEGYYDGLLFHRVINEFMIQGGDPTSRDADSTAMLGSGGPGYTLPAEIKFPSTITSVAHWRLPALATAPIPIVAAVAASSISSRALASTIKRLA